MNAQLSVPGLIGSPNELLNVDQIEERLSLTFRHSILRDAEGQIRGIEIIMASFAAREGEFRNVAKNCLASRLLSACHLQFRPMATPRH